VGALLSPKVSEVSRDGMASRMCGTHTRSIPLPPPPPKKHTQQAKNLINKQIYPHSPDLPVQCPPQRSTRVGHPPPPPHLTFSPPPLPSYTSPPPLPH
jgi:hypothetical protein